MVPAISGRMKRIEGVKNTIMRCMRQILAVVFSVLLVVTSIGLPTAAASENEAANRYNIVFVNDESGSMNTNDNQLFRYEAIRRFVALMAQDGNRIGSVSFNEKIIDQVPMKDIKGFADKTEFVEHISQFAPDSNKGMTNIGLALKIAVELLNSGRNPDLPSIIILLTDGQTQMPTEKEKELSLEQKADAIEDARRAGYQIYSVHLAKNAATADNNELKQIAAATGGASETVDKAEDLEEVQMMFYKIIFNALTDDAAEAVIGPDGKATQSFNVPGIGVEELNIIIEGDMTDCSLEDPNGKLYSGAELQNITMTGKDFKLIKVTDPIGGKWTATAYGDEGVKIKFKPLYNSSFYINASMQTRSEYKIGDTVTFDAVICDKNGPVTDTSRYTGIKGTLYINDQKIDMRLGSSGFTSDFVIENDGTYYAYIEVNKDDLVVRSDKVDGEEYSFSFSVDNRAPLPPEEELTAHANVWPFFGGSAVLDLTGAAVDPDGDPITYSIVSTAFNEEDYSFTDNVLTVDHFSIKKGSFTVRAADSRGAYCSFDVLITSTNIGLIMFIALCVGAVIVLAALIFAAWKLSQLPFNGDITVTLRHGVSNGASDTKEAYMLPRGSTTIALWDVDVSEFLPRGTRLQAGSKKDKCIYLITKTPVYSEMMPGRKLKKHKIRSGEEIIFNMDSDTSYGVKIGFLHNDVKNMW